LLVKHYRSTLAVDNLSFGVHPGTVTGFLGPNGAGKTNIGK
jgi:ABC-2 type transport system ATP-binding protein